MAQSQLLGTERRLRDAGIVAIVRGNYAEERLQRIAEALLRGGVRVMEVTLNSQAALEGIARLRRGFGDELLVGAGTVRTVGDVERATGAGAQFLVSPNFDPESVERSRRDSVLHLPGVFTASEAQAAFAAGCRTVKLFPADFLGPAYLKALRAPLDDIGFVPTGGIEAGNLADYIRAGAVAVGVGSALVSGPQQDLGLLTRRAEEMATALVAARRG